MLQTELAQQPKMPQPPAGVQNDRQKLAAWYAEWQQTPEGKAWRAIGEANNRIRETMTYFHASPDKEGNFTIDDVPPGSYQLSAYLDQGRGMGRPTNHHITVPAAEDEKADAQVDAGEISLDGT
jgi:ABC-type uncharacterized transport system permease subunit